METVTLLCVFTFQVLVNGSLHMLSPSEHTQSEKPSIYELILSVYIHHHQPGSCWSSRGLTFPWSESTNLEEIGSNLD